MNKTISLETGRLCLGLLIVDILICGVFLLLKKFNYTVVLGVLLGSAGAVLNFFLLGVTMQKAANQDDGQKKLVQASYSLRMMLMALTVIVGALLPYFHTSAVIVPFLCNTPVILVLQLIDRAKEKKQQKEVG